MNRIKQGNKKYINRKFLKKIIGSPSDGLLDKALARVKTSKIVVDELRKVLRVLVFHYLRDVANMSLLTSTKIYKSTLPEHFWRKREISKFLFGNGSE